MTSLQLSKRKKNLTGKRTSAIKIVPLVLNQDPFMLINLSKCGGISASVLLQQDAGRVQEAGRRRGFIGLGHVF